MQISLTVAPEIKAVDEVVGKLGAICPSPHHSAPYHPHQVAVRTPAIRQILMTLTKEVDRESTEQPGPASIGR